ncbi:MAG: uracil-DNA glycosylase [Hyphomicrobiales bacterium]|nr:uracil-DNA glycosylase [Hyphomicrobiales bacterium]
MLDFYSEVGVDETIATDPVDWFASVEARKKARAKTPAKKLISERMPSAPPAAPRAKPAPVAPDAAVMDARERASGAKSLDELATALAGFDGCPLKTTAKNTCFKRGSNTARIMFIGEGPGRDEDIQGLPFVGRAGQLLDKMLAATGLGEEDVYITNIVYWRPPGNRTPTPQEVEACAPFLERQIELLNPDFLVLIGGPASHHILGTTEGITRLRGKWRECDIGGKMRNCLPILHPAYLLRTPVAKRQAWRDMLEIEAALKKPSRDNS